MPKRILYTKKEIREQLSPYTIWGWADDEYRLMLGATWYCCGDQGGLCVTNDFADKNLSNGAKIIGRFFEEKYWFSKEIDCFIPFFEQPYLAELCGFRGMTRIEMLEIIGSFPDYSVYVDEARVWLEEDEKNKILSGK